MGALVSCSTVLRGFGDTQKSFPVAEVSSGVTGSVSSCKDQVSLGLGCLYLLVLLPNKQHLQRAEHPSWMQRAPWGCGGPGAKQLETKAHPLPLHLCSLVVPVFLLLLPNG